MDTVSEFVALEPRAAVVTEEEGTISGELDLCLDDTRHGLVRYRGTGTWYRIGNLDAEPPRTWPSLPALVKAVTAALGERDFAGNVIAFEACAAGPDQPTPAAPASGGDSGGAADAVPATGPAASGGEKAAPPAASVDEPAEGKTSAAASAGGSPGASGTPASGPAASAPPASTGPAGGTETTASAGTAESPSGKPAPAETN